MKKIIILKHGDGELTNQLWNFVSIYAYCLEKDFDCQNPSFFEYGKYFNISIDNKLINWFFFKPFKTHHHRRYHLKNRFYRFLYKIYSNLIKNFHKNRIISSANNEGKKFLIPPTENNQQLSKFEKDLKPIYFVGWMFRNPKGIERFKKEIIDYFKPKKEYTEHLEKEIKNLKNKYKNIIGIHIRQSDYKTHKGGKYHVDQNRIGKIINEYMDLFNLNPRQSILVITSDEKIEKEEFKNLNIINKKRTAIEDLYLLSLCDVVLGSDSSFGHFASFYGDIPHIIFKKENMDWVYYKDKRDFFENKYSTLY